MRLPLSVRLLGALRTRLGGSVAQLDPAEVPAARERSGRIQAGPLGRVVVGAHPPEVAVEEATLDTGSVTLPVRLHRPPRAVGTPPPLVVNFHGGGFVQGDLAQCDWFCGQVSLQAGAVVVSVDYRLAPEHPFPTPVQDCYDAVAALVADAGRWGVDPAHVVVMGDSAGGNMAAVVCLMARDRAADGLAAPRIAGQCLLYPGVEMVDVLPSERAIPHAPILDAADIRGFHRLYLAGDLEGAGTHPYASPLRADHTGLPPALVQIAEHDPLRDHGARYAEALEEAGVPVRLTCYQGAPHGYAALQLLLPHTAHQAAWEVAHHVTSCRTARAARGDAAPRLR